MPTERPQVVDRLRRRLLSETPLAGCGYYSGKAARIEPTCWVVLALAGTSGPGDADGSRIVQRGLAWLASRQRADGLLVDEAAPLANFATNGLALVTFNSLKQLSTDPVAARLIAGLVGVKGVRLQQGSGKQNDQLQGWPWVPDTFTWVEPTAWCTLGLKQVETDLRPADASARIAEAELVLLDRVCTAGGWNYGNASTLGQDLRPYVPTTALGLLAMQDRRREPAVQRSSQWMENDRLTEPATISLALTAMALKIYGIDTDVVEARLMDAVAQSERSGHLLAIAMAVYALSADRHNLEALRVRG